MVDRDELLLYNTNPYDPDTDADSDLYTGSTSDLLWLRVATEGSAQGIELLVNR